MGQQHNSHVVNNTNQPIKVVLTDNNNRNTSQIIEPGQLCIMPTVHGAVTLSVYPEEPIGNAFVTTPVACFTNESNRNFSVKKDEKGRININRLRYGSTTITQHGMQDTHVAWNILRALHVVPKS